MLRKIEAIIRPEKLSSVKEALEKLGYPGITITDVKGHGKQKGLIQQFRGKEYRIDLLQKVKIELVVNDTHKIDDILDIIIKNARTGDTGDGKIFVWPLEDVIRIRTGEKGSEAV
jgi:nitrogen regulatory protein P-II 1